MSKPLWSVVLAAGVVASPRLARADVSSWLHVAPGYSWTKAGTDATEAQPCLQLATGLGTPPADGVIVGGLFHVQTHFGNGTDLGLLLRVATHGFVNGGWGAAVDLGGYERWWGPGSAGGMGQLVLGAPWGVTLAAGGGTGSNDARHYAVTLGLDLARLTVYRRTGTSWWKNPFPAYRPEE